MKAMRFSGMQSGFLLEKPLSNLKALNYCGEATCVLGAQLGPGRHPCFEFLYAVSGAPAWKVGRRRVRQEMGDLLVVFANEVHCTDEPLPVMHHLWIGLELEKLGPEGRRTARMLHTSDVRLLKNCHAIEHVLRAIVSAAASPLPDQRRVILAYLDTFFVVVQQRLNLMALPKAAAPRTHLPYSYQVQTAMAYMERNVHRNLALSELARVANTRHVSNFCVLFRREVGATPAAFHLRMRLDAARDALLKPGGDITSIALAHGFHSHQHFSTAFRRAFSTTPLKWKKKQAAATRASSGSRGKSPTR